MRGLIDLLGILFSDFVVFNIRGIVIDDDTEGKTGLRVGARQGADVLDFGSVHIDLYQGVAGDQAVDGFDLLVIIHQHIIQNGKACQRLQCGDQVVGTVDSDQHTLCRPGGDLGDLVIGEVQIHQSVEPCQCRQVCQLVICHIQFDQLGAVSQNGDIGKLIERGIEMGKLLQLFDAGDSRDSVVLNIQVLQNGEGECGLNIGNVVVTQGQVAKLTATGQGSDILHGVVHQRKLLQVGGILKNGDIANGVVVQVYLLQSGKQLQLADGGKPAIGEGKLLHGGQGTNDLHHFIGNTGLGNFQLGQLGAKQNIVKLIPLGFLNGKLFQIGKELQIGIVLRVLGHGKFQNVPKGIGVDLGGFGHMEHLPNCLIHGKQQFCGWRQTGNRRKSDCMGLCAAQAPHH